MNVRVLLVDDHKLMRDGLRAILEHAGFEVIGDAQDGHEAIAQAHRLRPNVVLMDVSMAGLNGIDATRRIVSECPETRVLGVSQCLDPRYALAMFRAGATGYLQKCAPAGELIQAVTTVASHLTYVSPSIAADVVNTVVVPAASAENTRPTPLSQREREVLQLLAEGNSSKEIAVHLGLAVTTIETHRRQIMDKLQLRTVAALTKYAIREGITSLE